MSHGKNKRNVWIFDPLAFAADITQHIPDKSSQLIRYYGWCSNRMRGDRLKVSAIKGSQEGQNRLPQLSLLTTAGRLMNNRGEMFGHDVPDRWLGMG